MSLAEFLRRVRTTHPVTRIPEPRVILTIVVLTGAILTAEGLLFRGLVQSALLSYLFIFIGCSLLPLVVERGTTVFRAFLLVPLFRLVNLGMPVLFESTFSWLVLIYGTLIVSTYVLASDQPEVSLPNRQDVRGMFVNAPLAVVLAGTLGSIESVVLRPEALVQSWTEPEFLIFLIVMVAFVGLGEEFLFRGVLQRTLSQYTGILPSITISSLIFGMMHSPYGVAAEIGFGIVTGLLFGVLYYRTDNLLLVALAHGTLNVFLFGPFAL